MVSGLLLSAWCLVLIGAPPDVELVGAASIPGDARDKSGLTDVLGEGTPHDRLGSFGSAIAYTGRGNRYIAANDRGPADGASEFRNRVQTIDLIVRPGSAAPVEVRLVGTTLLEGSEGVTLVGSIRPRDPAHRRLDPEGLRLSRTGTLWISEEYGPTIEEYSIDGRWLRAVRVPSKFEPDRRPEAESMPGRPARGRYPNRGLEGLAISPDGERLFAIMQGPLAQDDRIDESGSRQGMLVRLVEVDIASGQTREYAYGLDQSRNGVCEILANTGKRFLVLERDGAFGAPKRSCAIFEIDVTGATDISGLDSLTGAALPAGVAPVAKKKFLDLTDPRFGIAGPTMAEKFEGLAFGPDLPDGRRLLIVSVDNDMKAEAPTLIYAFAVEPSALTGLEPQRFEAGAGAVIEGAGQ